MAKQWPSDGQAIVERLLSSGLALTRAPFSTFHFLLSPFHFPLSTFCFTASLLPPPASPLSYFVDW
jgi:hypothetical protein